MSSSTSSSTEMKTQSTDSVAVIKLVNHYIAIHITKERQAFISKHPEKDIKVAQAAAESFAKTHNVFYEKGEHTLGRAIITVFKHEEKWFPAALLPDRIRLLKNFGPLFIGGSQEEATNLARVIASSGKMDCVPSIGISLAK